MIDYHPSVRIDYPETVMYMELMTPSSISMFKDAEGLRPAYLGLPRVARPSLNIERGQHQSPIQYRCKSPTSEAPAPSDSLSPLWKQVILHAT